MITSLQRDKLSHHVVPIWLSAEDVDVEQVKIADRAPARYPQAALEQKKRDDQALNDVSKLTLRELSARRSSGSRMDLSLVA
ncbi:hypothetical protein H8A99_16485 [Bradyrhizobium sp. Arg68]|uniref:hypothetical protein n=1 Tax=Bradyrhizobium ivorense TaxID=2511166 RepID=UPI001E4AFB10|nr:hypothetical protein [Bradyrhizobium ivorense]MCC8938025.1 hypothetical protein [Bradyrhizobium ivorense]